MEVVTTIYGLIVVLAFYHQTMFIYFANLVLCGDRGSLKLSHKYGLYSEPQPEAIGPPLSIVCLKGTN